MKYISPSSACLFALLLAELTVAKAAEPAELPPGLLATYDDGERTVSEVVLLPELGLRAGDSPHPAIKPAFKVTYEGILLVTEPGRYRFETDGKLSLGGKPVDGEVDLSSGRHALRLGWERNVGAAQLGLNWQSEHFVEEPVPPTVLWHPRAATPSPEKADGHHPAPPPRIAKALEAFKCASCHEANFLATMHHRFAPEALLTHMRHANPMKWYGAMTGPLLEESDQLRQLDADLRMLPRPTRQEPGEEGDAAKGLQMVGTQGGGLACIACHDIKHHRTPAETKGPNLSTLARRVNYDWFVRWMENPQRLKPGVAMPMFFAGQPPDQRQANIDALWAYLQQGDAMPVPKELVADPQQFVLKPTAKPLVNRVYLRLPDGRELLRAVCVGLPNGVSYCFDAETCRLAYVWTGGYLDMTDHWKNQSLHPVKVVGETLYLPPAEEGLGVEGKKPEYRGFELVGGNPRFEFMFGDTEVRLLVDAPAPGQVRQAFSVGEGSGPMRYVFPERRWEIPVPPLSGKWERNRLTIGGGGEFELLLKVEGKEQE